MQSNETNQCKHEKRTPNWDYVECDGCGQIGAWIGKRGAKKYFTFDSLFDYHEFLRKRNGRS